MSSVNYKYSVWMVTSSNTESNSIISNVLQLDKTYSITEIKLQLKTVSDIYDQIKEICTVYVLINIKTTLRLLQQ